MRRSLRLALMFAAVLALGGPGGRLRIEDARATAPPASSGQPRRGRPRGVGATTTAPPTRAASTASAGSSRSASRTTSTRPASTSGTRGGSSRTCCCGRSSATSTSRGAAGNELSATSPPACPAEDRGLTYTYTLQERREVRPAGEPRGHVEGCRLRDEPARQPEGRWPVLLLLHRDQGLGRRRQRQGEDDLRHRDADDKRSSST